MWPSKLARAGFALIVGINLALFASGCAKDTPPVIGTPIDVAAPPPSSSVPIVATTVRAAGQSLTLAMRLAKVYTDLPRCDAPAATVLCSEREIVRKIRSAAITAHNAYLAARKNEALLGTAVSAIDLFTNIIPR